MDYRNRDKNINESGRNDLTTRERERMATDGRHTSDTNYENRETTDYRNRDENRRLHFLTDLSDYKVASGDPDVRGWEVVDVNNKPVGKIDNLLVDIRQEKVRYLDVDLHQDIINENHDPLANNKASGVHEYIKDGGDVHMIVPIGLARIDNNHKKVISDEINRSILESGHVHRKGEEITPEYECNVIDCVRDHETGYAGTEREVYNMKDTSPADNREMRRPESNNDTQLSKEADRRTGFGKESRESNSNLSNVENPYREARDRGPHTRGRGLEDERLERRSRDAQTRGPVNDDFYNQSYFDDRRFYGRQ